jgi:nitroreductase
MNQVIDTIMKRRSVRFYKNKPIPRDQLEAIIQAGNYAPTGAGTQMWRFVVIEDDEFRKKLAELALTRYKKWMENAPDMLKTVREEIDSEVEDPVYYSAPAIVFVIGSGVTSDFDCPMVCENMMLAAKSLEIGSCWVYFGQLVLDDPQVREALEMKENEKVYGPILLGYPEENLPGRALKREPLVKWI